LVFLCEFVLALSLKIFEVVGVHQQPQSDIARTGNL
jgi:hypothetical protein